MTTTPEKVLMVQSPFPNSSPSETGEKSLGLKRRKTHTILLCKLNLKLELEFKNRAASLQSQPKKKVKVCLSKA